ncbi:hypothetical protein NQ011_13565, partial [Corynebacterium phoceense]|uniref:hypothetical protein n=1 Tax=Corynebacterium phoceense TaxID=1686286 RepID=UPI00211BF0A4
VRLDHLLSKELYCAHSCGYARGIVVETLFLWWLVECPKVVLPTFFESGGDTSHDEHAFTV